jgi:hypothetical protein
MNQNKYGSISTSVSETNAPFFNFFLLFCRASGINFYQYQHPLQSMCLDAPRLRDPFIYARPRANDDTKYRRFVVHWRMRG